MLRTADQDRPLPNSEALSEVITAYQRLNEAESSRIGDLLHKSSLILSMPDPLSSDCDFGVHEWLRGRREENYSAWLAWCLKQLRPCEIAEVLGLDVSPIPEEDQDFPTASREVAVPAGEDGQTGRLDILLHLTPGAVVAVEVKMGSADSARVLKHEGYMASLRLRFPEKERFCVLVATDGNKREYHGFQLIPWRHVTLGLRRRMAVVRERAGIVHAAMLGGFLSAVERNLLGLDVTGPAQLAWYLEEFVEGR